MEDSAEEKAQKTEVKEARIYWMDLATFIQLEGVMWLRVETEPSKRYPGEKTPVWVFEDTEKFRELHEKFHRNEDPETIRIRKFIDIQQSNRAMKRSMDKA